MNARPRETRVPIGPIVAAVAQADIGEHRLCAFAPVRAAGNADIVEHALPGEQACVLE